MNESVDLPTLGGGGGGEPGDNYMNESVDVPTGGEAW